MIFRTIALTCNFVLFLTGFIFAQESKNTLLTDKILESIANLDDPSDFSSNESFLFLSELIANPLPFSMLDEEMITHFLFLSSAEKAALQKYIKNYGTLQQPYELQIVDGLPIEKAKLIAALFRKEEAPHSRYAFRQLLPMGKTLLRNTWRTDSRGYEPYRLASQTRLAYQLPGYYSIGLTLDKDQGERFLYDHVGFHLYIRNPNKKIEKLLLGDYKVRVGQGLILNDGLGPIKGSSLNMLKISAPTLMPHQSPNEYFFQRGAAIKWALHKNWKLATFASFRKLDASIQEENTDRFFRTIRTNGLHRTASEIRGKNAVSRFLAGSRLQFGTGTTQIGLNFLHSSLSIPLRRTQLYQQFWAQGKRHRYVSLDYSHQYKNLSFYGETAWQNNHAWASQNALGLAFESIEFMFIHRFYHYQFESLWGNGLRENSRMNDENGFFAGFRLHIVPKLHITSYADFWSHRWIRFGLNQPSSGSEFMARADFAPTKANLFYALFRYRQKPEQSENRLQNRERLLFRLNYQKNRRNGFSWRSRFDLIIIHEDETKNGFLVFQDFMYRGSKSKTTLRLAYYNTDHNARLYTFEPNLSYQFNFTSFEGTGLRPVILYKYNLNQYLKIEFKAATEILRRNRYEIGLQINAAF